MEGENRGRSNRGSGRVTRQCTHRGCFVFAVSGACGLNLGVILKTLNMAVIQSRDNFGECWWGHGGRHLIIVDLIRISQMPGWREDGVRNPN